MKFWDDEFKDRSEDQQRQAKFKSFHVTEAE